MPSSDPGTGLLATPCVTCREHHLKCDRETPRCGRCVRAGRECRLAFKFKSGKGNNFRKNQKWLRPPKKLIFIDETQYLMCGDSPEEDTAQYHFYGQEDHDDASESDSSAAASEPATAREDGNSLRHNSTVALLSARRPAPTRRWSAKEEPMTSRIDPVILPHHAHSHSPTHHDQNVTSSIHRDTLPPLRNGGGGDSQAPAVGGNTFTSSFANAAALPLKDRTQAILFRHYAQVLAPCLDCCDPVRHFELVVPERSSTSHTLLNAIFAISSRHLSHTTDFDPLASNRYHDECLKQLIPKMNHTSSISDENLFAATIILRMLEEMDGSLTGQDTYSHLLGIHAFVNVGDRYMIPGSLAAASFWVGLRQEIYIAIVTQQPVKLSLDRFVVDRSLEPADDYTWSNRAIVLVADVLNACFGAIPLTPSRWRSLNDAAENWTLTRPSSFDPFFYRERIPSAAFPEIWHGSSCHIMGIQHHLLAQLFLAQFDPSVPRVGTNRRAAERRMTQRIESLLRRLCGIGMSNQWTPPAMFNACMGIAMFGDQFSDRHDQEALADVLRKTEAAHARPTAAILKQLKRAWGWADG
ncbi:hypothetical protein F5Y16DRAFT_241696 [Xylariaceae sp. FL0255]|nr:hypothetical protein F5Y16DRAFT_241696 [Xylariaceae sp. FL0255]